MKFLKFAFSCMLELFISFVTDSGVYPADVQVYCKFAVKFIEGLITILY